MSWTITPSFTQWTPALISTALWFDASDSATLFDAASGGSPVLNNGTVARWEDKSGNARHLTQTISGARPLYLTNQINSRPIVRFDAIDDGLLSAYTLSTRPWMIYFVAKQGAGTTRIINSNSINSVISAVRPTNCVFAGGGAVVNANWANAGSTSMGGLVAATGSNFAFYGNGTNVTSGSVTSADWGVFALGSTTTWAEPANADICEVVVAASSDALVRQKLEGYLAHKWGLTANLPSNHPYKVNPPAP